MRDRHKTAKIRRRLARPRPNCIDAGWDDVDIEKVCTTRTPRTSARLAYAVAAAITAPPLILIFL